MDFEVGMIMNSLGEGIYGRLIGWRNSLLYGNEYNWTHSAIITEVMNDKIIVHEALTQGFVKKEYLKNVVNERIKKGKVIFGTVKAKLKNVKENAEKYLGRGYGFLDILHIIYFWLKGSEAKFLSTGTQALICSEAVARILYDASDKKINFEKEFLVPYDLIEPMLLWQSKYIDWKVN